MEAKWFRCAIYLILLRIELCSAAWPKIEMEHRTYDTRKRPPKKVAASDYEVPDGSLTPDYREAEPPFKVHTYTYNEENRPYRMSPHHIQQKRWSYYNGKDNPNLMGCYCTTVYKRLTPLAGCAVLTTRHILTTASSTIEYTQSLKENGTLNDTLGAWYDTNADVRNSSMYMTPARIHYHPKFLRPANLNVSHPVVGYFDLAVWASTYPFYGSFWSWSKACLCSRGSSHPWSYSSSTPRGEMLMVVGFQYILGFGRKPMPWFKYAVRTRATINPCPKTEWGWFHCVPGDWAKFGVESGAALHRALEGRSWRYDGLIGLNVFSMKLRAAPLVHYFHPVDTHAVLDFLYSAYMGRLPYDYLDPQFNNTQWHAPRVKSTERIRHDYRFGKQANYENIPYNY